MKFIALIIMLLFSMNSYCLDKFPIRNNDPKIGVISNNIEDITKKNNAKSFIPYDLAIIDNFMGYARFAILNKITAKRDEFELSLDVQKNIGKINIHLYQCYRDQRDDLDKALIKVIENEKDIIFSGWMISKYSFVNSMSHSLYDLIFLGCK